jgi:hypothetical protein
MTRFLHSPFKLERSQVYHLGSEMTPDADTLGLSHQELCKRIRTLTSAMMDFWRSVHGWAPVEAAGLLSRSMLAWQSSLSGSLFNWLEASTEGDLILAWANLVALVEGQLMLFLSVWYHDYQADAQAIRNREGQIQAPDRCTLVYLRQFFVRRIWDVGTNWNPYVELVQQRRNAIHAFRARDIGSFSEWREELRRHPSFVRDFNRRLPYPDPIFVPREK